MPADPDALNHVAPRVAERAAGLSGLVAATPSAAWAALALGVLTQCTVVGLGRFGFGLLLPAMRTELNAGYGAMGSIATFSFLGFMVGSLSAGLTAVRWGPRRVLVAALALAGAGTVATATASSIGTAVAWQLVNGLGSGGAIVTSNALVTAWFEGRRRGLATGICVGGAGIGMVAAGIGLPWVLEGGPAAWRTGWVALGLPSLFAALAAWVGGRDRAPGGGARPPRHAYGARRAAPVAVQPALLRTGALRWLALLTLCWSSTYIVFVTFFAAAGVASGLDAMRVGQLWIAVGVLSSWSCIVWGGVSDRLGRLPTLALVYALQGSGLAVLGTAAGAPWFYAAALLFGLGGWGTPALVNAASADLAGPRLAPAALGMLTLVFGLGQALGPLAAGLINDVTGGFAVSSLLAAGILFVGAVLALAGRRSVESAARGSLS
jgi:MFS family permease